MNPTGFVEAPPLSLLGEWTRALPEGSQSRNDVRTETNLYRWQPILSVSDLKSSSAPLAARKRANPPLHAVRK